MVLLAIIVAVFSLSSCGLIGRPKPLDPGASPLVDDPHNADDYSTFLEHFESDPKPIFATLVKGSVYRDPGIESVSPDGRYLLVEDQGLVAMPLFEGGRSVRLCDANSDWSSDSFLLIHPVGWASASECLWIAQGVQVEGPHEGSQGTALFAGSVPGGEAAAELVFFDSPSQGVKSIAWDRDGDKIYAHLRGEIWEMDIGQKAARRIREDLPTYDGLFLAHPSPLGTKFAYNITLPDKTALTILDNASGREVSIHEDVEALSYWPIWSPDGRYLAAFMANRISSGDASDEHAFEIFPDENGPYAAAKSLIVYDTTTDSSSVIRVDDKWLMWPRWSPDSGALFFLTAEITYDRDRDHTLPNVQPKYDGVWAADLDSLDAPEMIAQLPFSAVDVDKQYEGTWPVAVLRGGEGFLLEVPEADGRAIWVAARGETPYLVVRGNATMSPPWSAEAQTGSADNPSLALPVYVDGHREMWIVRSAEGDVVASKFASVEDANHVSILAFIDDKLVVSLSSPSSSTVDAIDAIGVYKADR